VNPVATTNATPEARRSELEVLLPNHGVPQNATPFFAEAVRNGARLLLVDAVD
jgi:hypothetical protein